MYTGVTMAPHKVLADSCSSAQEQRVVIIPQSYSCRENSAPLYKFDYNYGGRWEVGEIFFGEKHYSYDPTSTKSEECAVGSLQVHGSKFITLS